MLKNTLQSKLILLESAIFQGRKDGRQHGIESAYGELMMYLESRWLFRLARGIFRKRWSLKGGKA